MVEPSLCFSWCCATSTLRENQKCLKHSSTGHLRFVSDKFQLCFDHNENASLIASPPFFLFDGGKLCRPVWEVNRRNVSCNTTKTLIQKKKCSDRHRISLRQLQSIYTIPDNNNDGGDSDDGALKISHAVMFPSQRRLMTRSAEIRRRRIRM